MKSKKSDCTSQSLLNQRLKFIKLMNILTSLGSLQRLLSLKHQHIKDHRIH